MSDNSNKKFHAFLSHDWGVDQANHVRVGKINNELKARKFVTWFDTDEGRMTDHLNTNMADGIDGSRVGLAFVTQAYHDKVHGKARAGADDNCFKEFDFMANRLGKAMMVAVVLEREMTDTKKWTGPLGLIMAGKLYVDMTGDLDDPAYMRKQMDELENRINGLLGRNSSEPNVDQSQVPVPTPGPTPTPTPTTTSRPAPTAPPAPPAPPASYEDEVRRRVLDKVVKPTIKNQTEEEMNEYGAGVVLALAMKFELNNVKIQEIKDAMAGGGDTTANFFKILLKTEISIDEVSEALEELELEPAKEEWDRITEDKEMSDLELHHVQPMYRHLKHDAELPFAKSWVHLADSLDDFPQDKILALKESIKTGNQFSAAGKLLAHLTQDQVTVGRFLEKLNEVDQDRTMTSCKNVIKKVEADIDKAIANEIKKDKKKAGNK